MSPPGDKGSARYQAFPQNALIQPLFGPSCKMKFL